jgi:hypothetical protein
MSELWTPGDNKEQPSGGKIELPKGFARRRDKSSQEDDVNENKPGQPATETNVKPAEQEKTPPPEPPIRGQMPDFLFPPSGAQIQCPSCGTPFVAPVFSIVDLGANPELRQALLAGQINLAVCPKCGAGGPLSAPLMVHDPENEFLGVLVPSQAGVNAGQIQQIIGEMTKALMTKLPGESRRGYMLQPQQFFSWDRLLEKLWEFEGVTPEMLRRQQEQLELINSLVRVADDEEAMRLILDRQRGLVDDEIFGLLSQMLQAYTARGQKPETQALIAVRNYLVENTEAGAKVKEVDDKVRNALQKLKPEMSREELLAVMTEHWGEGEIGQTIVATILSVLPQLADYQFLMLLTERIEATEDPQEAERLASLREFIVGFVEQQNQSRAASLERVQKLLTEVLQSRDTEAALRERADQIDEVFLGILSENIQQAELKHATAAARRLRQVYEQALKIVQENMPPNVRLLNLLLSAPDEKSVRKLLQENRELLDSEFLETLKTLEERFRSEDNDEIADRLKSLHGQVALMV